MVPSSGTNPVIERAVNPIAAEPTEPAPRSRMLLEHHVWTLAA
jgi:hypothetical protein